MKPVYAIVNDDFVLHSEAQLRINDLAIQRGYGIFDFFKTINSKPVFLDDHLDRFFASASKMNLQPGIDGPALVEKLYALFEKNDIPDSGVRITLTGGYSHDGYTIVSPNLLITQSVFNHAPADFDKGIRLITTEHQRQLPDVKTIDYLYAIYMQQKVKEQNANDVLYVSGSQIRECPRANFFIVSRNGEVHTPATKILKGITRKKILAMEEVDVRETDVSLGVLEGATEAFITSTTKYILPVLAINGRPVGEGKPGPITRKIYSHIIELSTNQHRG